MSCTSEPWMEQVITVAGMAKLIDIPVLQCKETKVLVRSEYSLMDSGTESWIEDRLEKLDT